MGGLAARYAVGKLYKPPKTDSEGNLLADAAEESKGTIGGLVPINFITVATPHLGSRGNNQVSFFVFFDKLVMYVLGLKCCMELLI